MKRLKMVPKILGWLVVAGALGPGCPAPSELPALNEPTDVDPNPPPSSPPPVEPPVETPLTLEIIEPLPITNQPLVKSEQILTADELRWIWSHDCDWSSYDTDPLGPPTAECLRLGYTDWFAVRYRAYLKPNLNQWPAGVKKVTLRLFCLPESDTWQFSTIDGRELWSDWFPPAPNPSNWKAICLNDLPPTNDFSLANLWAERTNPSPNDWCELEITRAYRDWIADPTLPPILEIEGPEPLTLLSLAGPNHNDVSKRPRLAFESQGGMNFKLPLPGGKAWLLTTEAGGGDCGSGWVDPYHTDNNYYSLDFAPVVAVNNLPVLQTEVPILAAADGVVGLVEPSKNNANGCYVVLQHGRYSTRYLHLAEASIKVVEGQVVSRGDQLGIMGNTGESDGTHLHFGVRFDDLGSQTTTELQQSNLEGHQLDSLKIKCDARGRLTYCLSSNKP